MIARDLIDPDIHPLAPTDPVGILLKTAHPLMALPVVGEDGQYIGLLHRADLPFQTTPDTPVETLYPYFRKVSILPTQHPFEIIKMWVDHPLEIFPIVDAKGHYEGAVSLRTLRKFLTDLAPFQQSSRAFEVYGPDSPYAMRDLIQRLEGNGIQVLLVTALPTAPDRKRFVVSVPAHQYEEALGAMRRYHYRIEQFGEKDIDETLRDRLEYLQRMIEM